MKILRGNIVDIWNRRTYYGEVRIENGRIAALKELPGTGSDFLLPGFVDAHVHVESSMLVPSEFARLAVVHGTVSTVSDPHEIANVLGIAGVEFMIENGKQVPFKFCFGAPSCVPATTFETAGARLEVAEVEALLARPEIGYLSEMMNYPGVLYNDPEVLAKIAAAKRLGKPVDGHAPGLMGEDAARYAAAGISTDHECFTAAEAAGKLALGMKILIREGSAAKNFNALIGLLPQHADDLMFCSDDKHPDDLIQGHINQLVARAVGEGYDLYDVLRVACINPVDHYRLPVGTLRVGDPADLIRVEDLRSFRVKATWINGELVAEAGQSFIASCQVDTPNKFDCQPKQASDFILEATGTKARVIQALDGEIVTNSAVRIINPIDGEIMSDPDRDLLKIAVINRYQDAPPAVALIEGVGLKSGAIASCVGHDSHNIVVVGCTDEAIARAANLIIENRGGISAVGPNREMVVPLPVAGIMSNEDGYSVASAYSAIDAFSKRDLESTLTAPFMTLSFMALLVIPQLKLSDLGLFDGSSFGFTPLFVED
jgi:adenine deaminase